MRGDIFEYAGAKLPTSYSPHFKHEPAPLHFSEQARRLLDELEHLPNVGQYGSPLGAEGQRANKLMLIEKYLRAAGTLPQTSRSST